MKTFNSHQIITSKSNSRFRMRSGLSLIEILASVFVLSIGLVGVLAVLPFGGFQLNRSNIADYGGANGRGALHQVRMSDWYRDFAVWNHTGSTLGTPLRDFYANPNTDEQLVDPYIIDPLALMGTTVNHDSFPLTDCWKGTVRSTMRGEALKRYTLQIPDINNATQIMPMLDVNRYFYWQDDMLLGEDAGTKRPMPIIMKKGTLANSAASRNQFSWLYMVTPIVGHVDKTRSNGNYYRLEGAITAYDISAVVFNNRDLSDETMPETERIVNARFLSRSTTGGELRISVDTNVLEPGIDPETLLNVSKIKWVLITGYATDVPMNSVKIAKWYEVTSEGIYDPATCSRTLFVVGPDWNGYHRDPLTPADANDVTLDKNSGIKTVLCDGVVTVHKMLLPK